MEFDQKRSIWSYNKVSATSLAKTGGPPSIPSSRPGRGESDSLVRSLHNELSSPSYPRAQSYGRHTRATARRHGLVADEEIQVLRPPLVAEVARPAGEVGRLVRDGGSAGPRAAGARGGRFRGDGGREDERGGVIAGEAYAALGELGGSRGARGAYPVSRNRCRWRGDSD